MQVAVITNKSLAGALLLSKEINEILLRCGIKTTDSVTGQSDVVITVGGDGTVLRTASCGRPILGVHAGSVGFLTEIDKSELDLLERLASGNYHIEERMRIQFVFPRQDTPTSPALNEISLTALPEYRGQHCVNINAFADGKLFANYRGDGLIFATPTGSTGYSLSAGGAVFDPSMNAILLTPLYSHSLGAKPLVFSPETELSIVSRDKLSLSADGAQAVTVAGGERITIRKAEESVRFVRLKSLNFAERLDKLR